ncbi:GMC family oxidoreductase [Flammeovirga aprica]|uniref:GMC family oxidoreductase n=1 Tax=Flammeovirga aprica JL-4 TaxID=694437 RepID=A0A7X9RQP5_9BACT|nr:GMC family oxidoreductase [Flammeovirga aprica]NME66978.1 GMC family oxidoreductase [Flammeovirga aprica JL-4]
MENRKSHLLEDIVTDHKTASEILYDAVIVGAGISGAIMANELSQKGFKVLVVEAGPGQDLTIPGYEEYVKRFYTNLDKDPNAPYPVNSSAPMPRPQDIKPLKKGEIDDSGYIVQKGPDVFDGTYAKVVGGTTMHFQSNTPRMLPEDFEMKSTFDKGIDWPMKYDDLKPYYRRAEKEMGVAANVEDQAYDGMTFDEGYVFPMEAMPPTYLDKVIADTVDGTEINLAGEKHELKVRNIPQGRNGIPNPKYNNGKGFVPDGAVSDHQAEIGERCQGNTNCTPICPVQAKYDARKTLAKALHTDQVDFLNKTIASKVIVDPNTGEVTSLEVKYYDEVGAEHYEVATLKARKFILAGNAIENACLMLASGLKGESELIGKNLTNHIYLFNWALMPENVGAFRGTQGTSGIENFRSGQFRNEQAAFHMDIINNGWNFATGAPYSDVADLVDNKNKYGKDLRKGLVDKVCRQVLFTFMVEMTADPNNAVTVDPQYKDKFGNLKPVVSFKIPEYTLNGLQYGRKLAKKLFQQLGAEDYTEYNPTDWGYIIHNGEGIVVRGGNHFSGTHIMGDDPKTSVVDTNQKSWDHQNLFLVGSGSMPTIGTSNTTLTLAALCYKTADAITNELNNEKNNQQKKELDYVS